MSYIVGVTLALLAGSAATIVGMDRDRAFYPTVMIAIASFYALFAVIDGSLETLVLESVAITIFCVTSFVGFRTTLWLVVAALVAHGAFDFFHGHFISNSGVPVWWPTFCLAFDVTAGLYLSCLLATRRVPAGAAVMSSSRFDPPPGNV